MKRILSISVFLILGTYQSFAQCAMCRAVLESGDDQAAAEGINDGIVFLMSIPYILVAVIGYIIYWKFFRSSNSKNTSELL